MSAALLENIRTAKTGISAFNAAKALFSFLEHRGKSIADLIDSGNFEATFKAVLARYESEDDYVKQVGLKKHPGFIG